MWFFGKFYLVQVARKTLSPNYNWTSVSEVCSQRVFVCVCLPIDYKVASLKLFPRINRHYVYFRKFPSFVACSVLAATKWELQAVAVAADSVSLTSVNAILFRIKFNQIELLLPITTGRPFVLISPFTRFCRKIAQASNENILRHVNRKSK